MGLGSAGSVSLAAAGTLVSDARQLVARGLDPIEARLNASGSLTFAECADRFIAGNAAGWRNAKHASQWKNTLDTYAGPAIGKMVARDIAVADVVRVLEPIWRTKTETAGRVRSRIEAVLDWARVHNFRDGENPARWRGHLDQILPKRSKVRRVRHHPALPFADLPAFLTNLRGRAGVAARALEFTILTAARTGETIGATGGEFDLGARLWVIPGERMKMGRDHRVPLVARCVDILQSLGLRAGDNRNAVVFIGGKATEPLSNGAMLALLDRMGRGDITVHGFRSTFRDWASETTPFPNEVIEMALAHAVADKTEAAYRRGDLFEKRRELMDHWAVFCASGS
jgi:integrase